VYAYSQEIVEKRIDSKAENILIEFDLIDHIDLLNSDDESIIIVRAEGTSISPSFQLEEKEGHVLLSDHEIKVVEESLGDDKVCQVEPNYISYQIYVPKGKTLYISFIEGNLYSNNFSGDLNVKVEDGIIKLRNMNDPVKLSLNSGSVFLNEIRNTKIDAETNLGVLINKLRYKDAVKPDKKLFQTIGKPENSIVIRTILANIYLNGPKD